MTLIEIAKSVSENIDVEYIFWQRTSFPFNKITAKEFYKSCYREFRCRRNNTRLCDFCSRVAMNGDCVCERCCEILKRGLQ
jgi:hypothetical protein